MNKVLINRVRIKARKIAIPPHLGIGLECTLRPPGISMAPNLVPSLPANGVSTRERSKAIINVARIVVISVCPSASGFQLADYFPQNGVVGYDAACNYIIAQFEKTPPEFCHFEQNYFKFHIRSRIIDPIKLYFNAGSGQGKSEQEIRSWQMVG